MRCFKYLCKKKRLFTASPIALASLSPVNLKKEINVTLIVGYPACIHILINLVKIMLILVKLPDQMCNYLAKGFSPQHSVFFGPALALKKDCVNVKQKMYPKIKRANVYCQKQNNIIKNKHVTTLSPAQSILKFFFGISCHNTPSK